MKKQITLLFVMVASIFSGPLRAQTLGDIDYNFWGLDASSNPIDPANGATNWNLAQISQIDASGITFSPSPTHTWGALQSIPSGTYCLSEHFGTKGKGAKTMSMPEDTSCQHSYNESHILFNQGLYAAAFDTSMAFVERCPTDPHAPGAFGDMTGDIQQGGDGPTPQCLPGFRSWLISALAWNPGSPTYFCADVQTIMGTFGTTDTGWVADDSILNDAMSVLYWLQQNPSCYNSSDSELYAGTRGSQIDDWRGRVDTSKVPLDTTIYTMQQLGLDSVLLYAGLLSVSNNTPSIITNATAYPNPAGEGTVISFGITREAYVSVNLFNVLGHQVENAGFGGVVEPGNLSVPMSLQGLPSGTYFARIVTTFGEVQSVKIVKE